MTIRMVDQIQEEPRGLTGWLRDVLNKEQSALKLSRYFSMTAGLLD